MLPSEYEHLSINLNDSSPERKQRHNNTNMACWWCCCRSSNHICRHRSSIIELASLVLVAMGIFNTIFLAASVPSLVAEPLPSSFGNNDHPTVGRYHTPMTNNTQFRLQQQRDSASPRLSQYHPSATNKTIDEENSAKKLFQHEIVPLETHKIPKILLFTHYRNLLKDIESLVDEEEIVLSKNILHSIELNNPYKTIFLTDEDCINSLNRVFPSLIPYFKNETQGMYKADICRGSALYENGGIYLDVDIGVRKDLWLDLLPNTEFVTSKVHQQSNYPNHFFQAILGAAPKSPIIYKYLELFYNHYSGKKGEIVKKGPLGVILLRRAWDRVYNATTHTPYTELYSEVLYNKKLFPNLHPAPTWGTRRACHFVVVAHANYQNHTEVKYKDLNFHIPLYSRVAGSRMCPTEDKQKERSKKESN